MKFEIILTEQADTDLRSIYEYIAFTLLEPSIATGQLKRIEDGIMSLDEMPERFREFQNEPWRSRGLRQMLVDNFLVFYIPRIAEKTVCVIRVMYGGRDIDEQFHMPVR